MEKLIQFTETGIYVPRADIYIDPWKPVSRAIITHGHADHARPGSRQYLTHSQNVSILKFRLGNNITVQGAEYGETISINNVQFTLYPAGHIAGSSQVLIEYRGERWVISGDYKLEKDDTCVQFQPVKCNFFITESTFGLPVYNWKENLEVYNQINHWWSQNKEEGKNSVIIGYSLGKAQRIIENLDKSIGYILTHGAVENINSLYRSMGLLSKETTYANDINPKSVEFKGSIIVAPPSALGSHWLKRFHPYSTGLASGWMSIRGAKRRRNVDKGFVLSDHADWNGLNKAIEETEAEKVYVTHGYSEIFSEWLIEKGIQSEVVRTEFEGELNEIGEEANSEKE